MIIDLFRRNGVPFEIKRDWLWCVCPFHQDSRPSCHVLLHGNGKFSAGFFKCFSCGASGSLHKLGSKLNWDAWSLAKIAPKNGAKLEQIGEYSRDLENLFNEREQGKVRVEDLPADFVWRGIPASWISYLFPTSGLVWDSRLCADRLRFPVYDVRSRIVGTVDAMLEAERDANAEGPKYKNSKNMPIHRVLFRSFSLDNYAGKVLVIVEGPYDMLRLACRGIPSVALLGSQNWNTYKRDVLVQTFFGARTVIVATDNDAAGGKARLTVTESLLEAGLRIVQWTWEGKDAGDATPSEIRVLKDKVVKERKRLLL